MSPFQKQEILENYKVENRLDPGVTREERLAYESQAVEVDARNRAQEIIDQVQALAAPDEEEKDGWRKWK